MASRNLAEHPGARQWARERSGAAYTVHVGDSIGESQLER